MSIFSRRKKDPEPRQISLEELQKELEEARQANKYQGEGLKKERVYTVEVAKGTERSRVNKAENSFIGLIVTTFAPHKP